MTTSSLPAAPRDPLPSRVVSWAFVPHRVPAFMLGVSGLYLALISFMLAVPTAKTGFGAFAEDFKIWCFGLDPLTGKLQPMYVLTMLAQPAVLTVAILALFGGSLRATLRERPRALVPALLAASLVTAVAVVSISRVRASGDSSPPLVALRTALPGPTIQLTDHTGAPFSLQAEAGRVVLLTSVYASCTLSCPMILAEVKRAVGELDDKQRADVTVVAVTLDPTRDDTARLADLAKAQGVAAPAFRLLTGPASKVEPLLDDMGIARKRDPNTGVIDHANLFILIDRRGRVAYRFSLGESERALLVPALRTLVEER